MPGIREQLHEFPGIFRSAQFYQELGVAEQFRYLGQKFQVIFSTGFRHRQREQQVDGFAIDRVKSQRFRD